MKTKLISILFLLVTYVSTHAQQRIIGGSAVDITGRPYQAAVFVGGEFIGGGVIIADQWIVTAAHVVEGCSPSSVNVSTGYTNLNSDPRRSTVSQIIIHPNYIPYSNDIALIKLSSPIAFGSTRKPITISNVNTYPAGTAAVVSGWGQRAVGGAPSLTQLYKANVTIESCTPMRLHVPVSNNMSYIGDSGGPLTIPSSIGEVLIGLVSTGNHINPTGRPTDYTNIGNYYNWILTNCPNLYTVSGPDLLESTATYAITPLPQNYTLELSPNISLVSQSGNYVTVRAVSTLAKGRAFINVEVNNRIVGQKFFWVGIPIISGVTNTGTQLEVETLGISSSISQTEWTIDGNMFSAYDDFISIPNVGGRTFNVTVRARNACGWSMPFSTSITIESSYYYRISMDSNTRQAVISPYSDDAEQTPVYSRSANSMMRYMIIDMLTGSQEAYGTLSTIGGTIDLNSLSKGLYLLKLDIGDGKTQTFKINLN
ncbi:MAG: serine protease [Tannerellaceae bacterium]|jgi:V8-like Glu-specific endopeptidase|nr:serine protease [Tannerellaceae bacterium]